MDKSFPSRSDTQEHGGFFTRLRILDGILNSLVTFFQLTKEEQRDAGIYVGDPEAPAE